MIPIMVLIYKIIVLILSGLSLIEAASEISEQSGVDLGTLMDLVPDEYK